jgi:hypothetical protein
MSAAIAGLKLVMDNDAAHQTALAYGRKFAASLAQLAPIAMLAPT